VSDIRLSCPRCGFSRELPQARIPAGAQLVTCPHCKHRFPLPALSAPAPAPPADRSLAQLFDQTWELYRRRWATLCGLLLLTYLLLLIPLGLGLAAGWVATCYLPEQIRLHLLLIGALCGLGVGLLTMFWGYAAYLAAALDNDLTTRPALQRAWPLTGGVVWAVSLSGLLAAGAFCLLFIPGVILSVWLAFVPFLVVETPYRGMASLRCSRRLVAGHWWDVFVKFLVASLVPSAIGAVPLVGPLLGLAAVPFGTLMMVMVYRDRLAGTAAEPPAEPLAYGPPIWWGMALGGFALLGLALLFIASRLW